MLAQVFIPSEIKERTVPPLIRRSLLHGESHSLLNAGEVVLPGTVHSYCDAETSSILAVRICRLEESRRGAAGGVKFAGQSGI